MPLVKIYSNKLTKTVEIVVIQCRYKAKKTQIRINMNIQLVYAIYDTLPGYLLTIDFVTVASSGNENGEKF